MDRHRRLGLLWAPFCFLIGIVSVMTRLAPVRCGKSRPVVSKRRVGALTLRRLWDFSSRLWL